MGFIRFLAFQSRTKAKRCPWEGRPPAAIWAGTAWPGNSAGKALAGVVGSKMSTDPLRRACGTRACSIRRRDSFRGTTEQPPGSYREVVEKMEPGSAQHCMVGGQEAAGVH